MSAEIKLRKQTDKDFDERLQNYNEKFTYAMQSFQSTIGSLGARLNEQKELVSIAFIFKCLIICLYIYVALNVIKCASLLVVVFI